MGTKSSGSIRTQQIDIHVSSPLGLSFTTSPCLGCKVGEVPGA